jgi:S-adenosylmethionine-dependent methyltransferase
MKNIVDPTNQPTFDEVTGVLFTDYYKTIRGFVRENIVQQNIKAHLPNKAVKIIDIGGGEGRDAIWLAQNGHQVTLVEPSAHMLAKARQRCAKQPKDVQERLTILVGNDVRAQSELKPGTFDFVLSHGVLLYELDEPQQHVDRLFSLCKPGGTVSLLTKGWAGSKAEMISEERIDDLIELHETGRYKNHLGKQAITYDEDQLTAFINNANGKVIDWYGVRVMTDHMYQPVTEFSKKQLNDILSVEEWAGHKSSTRGLGQLLHFITQKRKNTLRATSNPQ